MKKNMFILMLFFLLLLSAIPNLLYAQPVQNPTNGHYYELITLEVGISWEQARDNASARSYNGWPGHLATVTSADENGFIEDMISAAGSNIKFWIGGYQLSNQTQPDIGWRWITGETWSFTDWGLIQSDEPNDWPTEGENNEQNYLTINQEEDSTFWGDEGSADTFRYLLVEYELICEMPFTDVPSGFWAEDYIKAVYCEGIASGYADNTFRPSENASRAQTAAFIIRANFGEDFSYSPTPYFSDVPADHWAFKYIQKMYDEGITTGYSDGTYRPSQNLQRSQMAAFIIKAKFPGSFPYTPTPYFSDVPSEHWAFMYVQKMYDEGITTGYADDTYRPAENVSRAQTATFIARALLGME